MGNSELRRRLQELAQEFVDGVLAAIRAVPFSEVASEIGGRITTSARGGAVVDAGGRGRGRARGREASAASAPAPSAERPRARARKLVRRAGTEIERIRSGILKVLGRASAPVGSAEIARELGGVGTVELSFPMKKLREAGLVNKQGDRTQAVYSLTDKARGSLGAEGGRAAGGRGRAAAGAKSARAAKAAKPAKATKKGKRKP